MKVDKIIKNAKIFTSNKDNLLAGALAIKDGKYVYVGDEAGLSEYEDMGITHLPVTSQESLIYAKELIGTRHVMGKNIIDITLDNYTTYYQSLLVGMVFIDFSLSEKIMNVVDAVDTASGLSLYDKLDATYFYGNF